MPRKKESVYETEQYAFPSRLRELMKDTGTKQKDLAQALGVKPQTVSLYTQGQSFPDVNNLAKIARFFDVSADYLIGLAKVPNVDMDIKKVNEITGLSAGIIEWLQSITSQPQNINVLNSILGNKTFQAIISTIDELKNVQIAAELDRFGLSSESKEVGGGMYLVGGYEYLSVLEYRISEYFKMVIDDITSIPQEDCEG